MSLDSLSEKKILLILLVCTITAVSIVPIVRLVAFEGLPQGEIAYYNQRMAKEIQENGLIKVDLLTGRDYHFNAYHLLLGIIGIKIGFFNAAFLIPIVLGLLSSLLFYGILYNLGMKKVQRFFAHLILLSSPPFIYIVSISTQYSLIVFLFLLACFFLFTKRAYLISLAAFILVSTFGAVESIFALSLLILFAIKFSKFRVKIYLSIVLVLLTFFFFPVIQLEPILRDLYLPSLVSDFGGLVGLGIFQILLAIIGIMLTWNQKKDLLSIYGILIALLIGFFTLGSPVIIYSLPFVSYFASITLIYLSKMKWEVNIVRDLTLIVIVCGLLFSTLSYYNQTTKLGPTPELVDALSWIRENSNEGDVVFSSVNKGFLIQEISTRKALSDNFLPRADLSKELYYSRSLKNTTQLLLDNDVEFILIQSSMKEKVWDREDQGLLFLLQNRETFKRQYSTSAVDIWRVAKT